MNRMDVDHRDRLEGLPAYFMDLRDIGAARQALAKFVDEATANAPDVGGMVADYQVTASEGHRLLVRIYSPDQLRTPAPALYWMHGGGMVRGDVRMSDITCQTMARDVGCVVASVEYRLAPENPHPTPIEDCYIGLMWLTERAPELGLDANRIAIGGTSAGGGMAASLALLCRDRGKLNIAFQLLLSPMLDDRNQTFSSHYAVHSKVWNRSANLIGWNALLEGAAGTDGVSQYAAAARATDLTALPQAYISVGELDLFLDESIAYATRLLQAGVPTELHVYPGAFHGSDTLVPGSDLSNRQVMDRNYALRTALHPRLA